MKIDAGPSGREVISLQKVDSLLVLANLREAKKVSTRQDQRIREKKPTKMDLN
jgi:hypothetical protein